MVTVGAAISIAVGMAIGMVLEEIPELAEVVAVGVGGVTGEALFDDEVLEKRRNSAVHETKILSPSAGQMMRRRQRHQPINT